MGKWVFGINLEKILEQFRGVPKNILIISVAHCHRVPNLVSNKFLGRTHLPNDEICKLSNYHVHEY